jgi:hypothetical protein
MATVFNGDRGVFDNATESAKFPAGTQAQRPDTPEAGMIRFNTEAGQFEYHDGTEWKAISE